MTKFLRMHRYSAYFLRYVTSILIFAGLASLTACSNQPGNSAGLTFKSYLQAKVRDLPDADQEAIEVFVSSGKLSADQQSVIQHQLGLYAVERYGDEALETLRQLVAIPTYRKEAVAQHDNPEFKKLAFKIGEIATDFGLAFRNVDDRVYEITLPGATDELVGLHAHGDVVQVEPENWVLDDGTKLDPFVMTQIGNRLYGRGTQDDKNGIVVTLYAMKVINDEKLPLNRTFKLLVDTTEETTGDAIPYYFERNPTPDYNLAMDGGYPVIIAEKGYGVVTTEFPVVAGRGEGMEFTTLTGGLASNQIPKAASALVVSSDLAKTETVLRAAADKFVAENGNNFTIDLLPQANSLLVKVNGVSAHSSDPGSGINPVSRLLVFIDQVSKSMPVKRNHITAAANYAADNWGLNYYAEKLGVNFSDAFMGPLTGAITLVELKPEQLSLAVNLRVPKGKPTEQLKQEITSKLLAWSEQTNTDFKLDITIAEPMYRNPKGAWVNALLDVATSNLNLPRKFAASAGATSVHDLPNGVQFGLSMPGVKYTGHNANEFKTIDQFMLDLQIVTEMVAKIGQLPELN